MKVIPFRQTDPRWGSILLGYNTARNFNLANYGCLISALASLEATITQDASWTPARMNQLFKDNAGFDANGGLLRWYKVPQLLPNIADHGFEPSNTVPKGWMEKDENWAILKVNNGAHYVLAINPTQIMDPLDGRIKSIRTYSIAAVRLYEAIGGKGSGGAIVSASVSSKEEPMTDEQEQQAYHIVLGRGREGVASGRTGLQFIMDAQGELSRQHEDQKAQMNQAMATIEELQRQAQTSEQDRIELRAALAAHDLEWQKSFREDKRKLLAKADARIIDLAGVEPDYSLKKGMLVRQAGTFIKDGSVFIRSQHSVDNNNWYGYPVDLFDVEQSVPDPDLTDHIQSATAQAYGFLERIANLFKKSQKGSK